MAYSKISGFSDEMGTDIVTQFESGGHSNVEYKFSVNDNLKEIVVLNLTDVANPTIGTETSVEATLSGDARPFYTYQSVQTKEQPAANLTIAYQIAKGNMSADDVYSGFKIRRYRVLHALLDDIVAADETKMPEDLYKIASDGTAGAFANIKWFLGEVATAEEEALAETEGTAENAETTEAVEAVETAEAAETAETEAEEVVTE